jgi:hypothetical protein
LNFSDKVRGHGFRFLIKIPRLHNWENKQTILSKHHIELINLNNNKTQRIIIDNHKIWLSDKSIVVFFPEFMSYLTDKAEEAQQHALYHFLRLVRKIEIILKCSLEIGGSIRFKISRQHYALIKNALAKQYDMEGKKLAVYDIGGCWLAIDNSFNLHELETFRTPTESSIVQNFFNDLKQSPSTLSQMKAEYYQAFAGITQQINAHLLVVNEMKELMKRLDKYFEGKI